MDERSLLVQHALEDDDPARSGAIERFDTLGSTMPHSHRQLGDT